MDKEMPLVDHLGELRRRTIVCVIVTFVGMVVAYCLYTPWILYLLKGPIDALSQNTENPFVLDMRFLRLLKPPAGQAGAMKLDLHFIGPMEVFMTKIKASFFAGLILASPVVFYQIWRFVALGLKERERRAALRYLPASLLLFLGGVLLAYFFMIPVVLYFLVIVSGQGLQPTLILSKYVSLVVVCCLAFGCVFQMPVVIFFLTRLGIVSPKFLIEKRKYAILLMFIVGAVLTPPDVITQMMMALPMVALYEVSIWLSRLVWKRREAEAEA